MDERKIDPKRDTTGWGVILIVIGLFLFLQNMKLYGMPHWVFSWQMLMVVLGLIIGVKHRFRGGAWFILTLLGTAFLIDEMGIWEFDFSRLGWPLVLVIIGVYMVIKRPYRRSRCFRGGRQAPGFTAAYRDSSPENAPGSALQPGPDSDDFLNVSSIFGGTERVILTKNFQGGDVTSIFGGSEVNLSQADFNGTVVIETTAIFGGVELIVPSNWAVKLEVSTIFGGVEDKRPAELMAPDAGKTLVIKGSCIFGGVEIKSYA